MLYSLLADEDIYFINLHAECALHTYSSEFYQYDIMLDARRTKGIYCKDYYFYPSVHKDNEHIDLEKSLWNEYNEYKNVLIICDMMPSMEYLAEILKSNTKLEACSKIYVLALFTNFNLLKQEQENKTNKIIRRYSLAKLNVPICEKDEENCLICKQNLGKIYSL